MAPMSETVEVPVSLLERMADASEALHALDEEFEDFLITQNQDLLDRLKRARTQHESGQLRPFSELLEGK